MPVCSLPFLLTVSLLHNAAISQEVMECEGIQRIELSRAPRSSRQICVSPGLMTGVVFEAPVSVELQEELRFEEVSRGRASISIMPPKDMAPGERLRLSVRYLDGFHQEEPVTLLLVASEGQATRQVEVFRDTRTRESFERELRLEQAQTGRLLHDLTQLRLEFEQFRKQHIDPNQLRGLIVSGSMTPEGVRARDFKKTLVGYRENTLVVTKGVTYRSNHRVAIELWLMNSSPEDWRPTLASVSIDTGFRLKLVSLWQQEKQEMNVSFLLVIEAETSQSMPPSEYTLSLSVENGRGINLTGLEIP